MLTTSEKLHSIYEQIKPYIRLTPLLQSTILGDLISGEVYVKPESLQVTGAFKFRGALHRLMQLNSHERRQGVIAYSSGNFARGLAHAGNILNIPVHLVMPIDAPVNKIDYAKQQNASITLCSDTDPSREEASSAMASSLAQHHGYLLLHPFDDPELINGQGTVGIELQQQLLAAGLNCNSLLCPSGGGSLVAGCSLTFSPTINDTRIYAIESLGYDGMGQSLSKQTLTRAKGNIASECDALLALTPGKATYDVAKLTGVLGLAVSQPYVKNALRLAFDELHLVLEPSGAIAIAAIMEFPEYFQKQSLVVIATGGNVDRDKYKTLIC